MRKVIENTIIGLVVLALSVSCKTIKIDREEIIGKYQWNEVYDIASNIFLNRDSSFIYHWREGLINGTTKGSWGLDGDILILNSDRQPGKERKDFSVKERKETPDQQFEITVIDEEAKYELLFAPCMTMNDTIIVDRRETDISGNCILPFDETVTKLRFEYVGYEPVEIPVNLLNSNSFIVEM